MFTARNQRTLAGSVAVEGFGFFSGRDVRVEFRPADIGEGIVFVRSDLPGQPRIPVNVEHRIETPRRTTLCRGEARVEMIEHILAALAGLHIDNCEIRADAAEMPGCDGSSLLFVDVFDAVGAVEQDALRPQKIVCEPIRLVSGKSWIEACPPAGARYVLRYDLDYSACASIGRQTFELAVTPESFRSELACCRTFLLQEEAQQARRQGQGLRATHRDLLVFDENGPIGNELRFASECVRHKVLDMVGDLALAGCDLIGRFRASRSGHRLNAELVRAITNRAAPGQCWKRCA